ncbi:hypothetical protein Clacol_000917 [Clathrus columnatus]|uniref:Uncharacterized protein n=1 Tax=Clathrus columnatus TaxID=1419009 RepID=A0AAV4ZXC8_9AGAM|nr:hypothetical protein Clacol_000917 [Clathrus columnatus]
MLGCPKPPLRENVQIGTERQNKTLDLMIKWYKEVIQTTPPVTTHLARPSATITPKTFKTNQTSKAFEGKSCLYKTMVVAVSFNFSSTEYKMEENVAAFGYAIYLLCISRSLKDSPVSGGDGFLQLKSVHGKALEFSVPKDILADERQGKAILAKGFLDYIMHVDKSTAMGIFLIGISDAMNKRPDDVGLFQLVNTTGPYDESTPVALTRNKPIGYENDFLSPNCVLHRASRFCTQMN